MSLTVAITDNATGHTKSQEVPEDDYLLIVTGTCQVTNVQTYPIGVHVLTIKGPASGFGTVNYERFER